jgi:hypothetical protein
MADKPPVDDGQIIRESYSKISPQARWRKNLLHASQFGFRAQNFNTRDLRPCDLIFQWQHV